MERPVKTELGLSESDDCHPRHTDSPIPKVNPRKDVVFSAIAFCYTAEETSVTQKDFCEGKHNEFQKINIMAMKMMIVVLMKVEVVISSTS